MTRTALSLPVLDRRDLEPIVLDEIDLYVTMRCNLTCDFCSVSANEYDHEEMPLERILEVVTEAHALGLKELHFSGGEPTLRKDLEPMIEHAANLGIHTRIITNGFHVTRERLRSFRDGGLDDVMVSLDGFADTQARFRGHPRSYERVLETVRECVDLGLRTRVSTVAYRENVREVVPLMVYLREFGIDIYSVFLGSPLGRGKLHRKDSVLSAAEWRRCCDEVREAIAENGIPFEVIMEQGFQYADGPEVDRAALKGRGTGCATLMESFDFLIVRADGSLFQCVFFVKEGKPIGSVAEMGLEEALRRSRREGVYAPFTRPNDRCVSCDEQQACGTGCRGYAYLYQDDWLKTDPRCSKSGTEAPAPYFPLCPILKVNAKSGRFGGSSEQAMEG